MAKYLKKFDTYSEYNHYINGDALLPNLSCCTENNEVYFNPLVHNYTEDYLTFVALESGTFSATADIVYSLHGDMWKPLAANTASPTVTVGQKIMWKRNGNFDTPIHFNSTGKFDVQGNIMSLYSNSDDTALTMSNSAANLFAGCKIVNAKNLVLPATNLSESCYDGMFYGCTSLTTAPQILPATELTKNCYNSMFYECTSLTTAPKLPAIRLAESCYNCMFWNCTSLVIAPELPAERLAEYCYNEMFFDCTSLITAPELPATTLAEGCYNSMFEGCTSLITAPELPATTLAEGCYSNMFSVCWNIEEGPKLPATTLTKDCYNQMFRGCTRLRKITCLATDISATDCTLYWVQGVASKGTFVKNSATTWSEGDSGIPSGWTPNYYNG